VFGFGGIRRLVGLASALCAGLGAALVVPTPAAGADSAPVNVVPPSVVGTARVGETVACRPGAWTGAPTSYGVGWVRDGWVVAGADGPERVLVAEDVGHQVTCRVQASNAVGTSGWVVGTPIVVQAPATLTPDPPATLDPPEGPPTRACEGVPSVLVGGGADWTRRRAVSLRITTPAGAQAVEISDRADFAGAVRRPLSGTCLYPWQLTGSADAAPKVIWVRFPGAADPTAAVSGRIRLDDSRPVVTRAHARWRNRRGGWVLTVRAEDQGSGLMWFQVARPDGTVRRTHPIGADVVSWDRSVIRRVRFCDRVGNRTGWVRVQFLS
jgi:hypothetical protein